MTFICEITCFVIPNTNHSKRFGNDRQSRITYSSERQKRQQKRKNDRK